MYKMLIADDEQIVLDGLTKSINWNIYNVEVTATALNGIDALEIAKQTKPDIIITDIKMPGLNGLELIKHLREFLPDAIVIIISAYEQFDFAKEAIKYGVFSYITKMIKKQTIIDTIVNAVEELDKRSNQSIINERLEKRFNESLPLLRDYFLNMLVTGMNDINSDSNEKLRLYGLKIGTGKLFCMVIMLDQSGAASDVSSEHNIQMKSIGIADIMQEELERNYKCDVFKSFKGEIIAVLSTDDVDSEEKTSVKYTTQAANIIKQRIFDELKCSVSIGISNVYEKLCKMQNAYADAQRALQYRLVYGENTVINIKNVDVINGNEHIILTNINAQLDQLKNILYTGKYDEIKLITDEITSKFNKQCVSYNYIQHIYIQMLSVIMRTIIEFKIDQSVLCPKQTDIYGTLLQKQSINEIEAWFDTILHNACEEICKKNDAKTLSTIQKAIDYMRQNVEQNISLSDVAEHIYFNSSYFSRYFKESTGMPFVEYMKQLKIERAKELLTSSNYKIYEICELLGYQSVQYFSTLFKNTIGITPQEYKEKHRV